MFIEFEDSKTGKPLAINPDYVVKTVPSNDNKTTLLVFHDKSQVEVKGEYSQVVAKLKGK